MNGKPQHFSFNQSATVWTQSRLKRPNGTFLPWRPVWKPTMKTFWSSTTTSLWSRGVTLEDRGTPLEGPHHTSSGQTAFLSGRCLTSSFRKTIPSPSSSSPGIGPFKEVWVVSVSGRAVPRRLDPEPALENRSGNIFKADFTLMAPCTALVWRRLWMRPGLGSVASGRNRQVSLKQIYTPS